MAFDRVAQGVLLAGIVLGLSATAQAGGVAEPFSETEVLVEINSTDGDAGFQGKLDGEPWTQTSLRRVGGPRLFGFKLSGDARRQGFTEFVWESAEPMFDEFGLAEFLTRFPEGDYEFRAKKLEGGKLQGIAELTHDLPAGPVITSPMEGEGVPSGVDLVVTWDAVTTEFDPADPQGTATPALGSEVVEYIVVLEFEDPVLDIGESMTFEVNAEGDASPSFSATIPGSFLRFAGSEGYKVEVGAVEESGNRTFWEQPFCTDMDCPEEEE